MEDYKREFIDFMVQSEVLTFGDFVTKSGRKTPFFINSGRYRTGEQITKLGEFYAKAIMESLEGQFDVLFGPAYKGIPLVVTTAVALNKIFNKNVAFCFNRKEVKSHGEGGNIIGHELKEGDRVVIVEDVITAGTSVRETVPLLKAAADVKLSSLVVSVNRMERGQGKKSALSEIQEEFEIQTFAIVTMKEVTRYLYNKKVDGKVILDDKMAEKIEAYYRLYGNEEFFSR